MELRSGKSIHKIMITDNVEQTAGQSGDAQMSELDIKTMLLQLSTTLNAKLDDAKAIMQQNQTHLSNQIKDTNNAIAQTKIDLNNKLDESNVKLDASINNLEIFKIEVRQNFDHIIKRFEEQDEKLDNKIRNLEIKTFEIFKEQDRKMTDIATSLKNKVDLIDNSFVQLETKIQEHVTDTFTPLDAEIQTLKQKINKPTHTTDRINVTIHPDMWKKDTDLKYYGDNRISPKIFIKNLKTQVHRLNDNTDLKKYIRTTLAGDAQLWHEIIENDYETFDEFTDIFLNYYWSNQIQGKIREQLLNGRYNENFGVTREKYAMRRFTIAKQLDPPLSDRDIIRYIARHFDTEICDVIIIHEISNIDKLLQYLQRIDDIKGAKRRRQYDNIQNIQGNKNNNTNYTNNLWRDGGRARNLENDPNIRARQNNNNNMTGPNNYYNRNNRNDRPSSYSPNSQRRYNSYTNSQTYRNQSPVRQIQKQSQQENTETQRQVKFDDIAIVHDESNNNQNFY